MASITRSLVSSAVVSRQLPWAVLCRSASTHANDTQHHASDGAESTHEGFTTPFWRKTFIFGVLGYGLYAFAPSRTGADGKEGALTSYIRNTLTSTEVWKERNEKHLSLSVDAAEAKQLTGTARRPVMNRIRYTGRFEDYSPHKQAIGDEVDLSDLVVKADSHMKQ